MPKKKAVKAIKREIERELMNDLVTCGRTYATTVALLCTRAHASGMTRAQIIALHFAALEELREPFEEALKCELDLPEKPSTPDPSAN